jgi:delta 1-pyrroline-5-carboxylate dehydrogenase
VLDHVTSEMRIYHEESFGPVKPVVRVKGLEAAVACANDNPYGLSAAVFGRDIGRAMEVAKRIESGICHVNGPTVHDEAQMPFGGVKDPATGRFGGKAGIEAFTELRWITCRPRRASILSEPDPHHDALTLAQASQIITAGARQVEEAANARWRSPCSTGAANLKAFASEDGCQHVPLRHRGAKAWGAVGMGVLEPQAGRTCKDNPNFFVSIAATADGKFLAQTARS